ncbi:MAG: PorP/SprF family type IX secretion system membrane protein [Flavisolibacter sp.]
MNKRKPYCVKTLLIAVSFVLPAMSYSQDIHFSQFFEAPLWRNPSLAGIYKGDIRVQGVYRDQWNSVTDAYKTGSFNAEYKMPIGKANDFITTGIEALYDKAGTVSWTSTHLLPALNYHKSLSVDRNSFLSLGFMGGPVFEHFDRSKMTTNSTYNGLGDGETFNQPSLTYIDGSVGMSYNTQLNENPDNNIFFGVAYHHFNRPKNSFYQNGLQTVEPKWVGSAGVRFSVTPASYLTIQGDYSKQGQFTEVIAGALYGVKLGEDLDHPLYTIHGGALLRWNDAFIPVIKLDYSPMSVAFSYDANISKLKTSSLGRGGFEVSVSYIGFLDRNNSTVNAVLCPRF